MKKKFFLVGAVALLGFGVFTISCTKKTLTCSCYTSDNVSQEQLQRDLKNVLKSLDILNDDCSDVEYSLIHSYGYSNMNCN